MSEKARILHDNVIDEIIQAWTVDQNYAPRNRAKKPLPSEGEVRALIEAAFSAGMQREEGQPLSFTLTLYPREKAEHANPKLLLPFDDSLSLTVQGISRLAPAFDPRSTTLLVDHPAKADAGFEIWGAMFFDPAIERFDDIPAGAQEFPSSFRPDTFSVTAVGPGSLSISRGGSRIASFESGEVVRSIPQPFDSEAMGDYIRDLVSDNPGFERFGTEYWLHFREALELVLAQVSVRGHGGTIIIVADSALDECNELYEKGYSLSKSLRLDELLCSTLELSRDQTLLRLELNKKVTDRLAALAQLACVDGALMLTTRLEIICFGARLKANGWDLGLTIGPDGFGGGGGPFHREAYGTRHKSAIDFIGQCPDAIGFVISHDGPIRGIARDDDSTVLVWPDCRESLFV